MKWGIRQLNTDGKVLFTAQEKLKPGDFAFVHITGASEYDLIGEAVDPTC